jgi:glycosyltransferase involved in cell wall biosynthesis
MPKVSVVIPNYNHARFLEKRIQSVLNQTFQDFEVIYLDDFSTDNSEEIFSQFSNDKRIRSILNKTNSGSTFKQWNKGFKEAKGDYIWFAESDDYANPRLLERLVQALENYPSAGLAYCQSWVINQDGDIIRSGKRMTDGFDQEHWQKDFFSNGREECLRYMILGNIIPNASAVLIRRSVYEQVGGANEDMRLSGDWLLWSKILLASDLAFVAEPLNYFRCHTNTVRKSSQKNGLYVEEACKVIAFIGQSLASEGITVQKVNNQMIKIWGDWIIFEKGIMQWERNRIIYEVASQICPNISQKLFSAILYRIFRKIAVLSIDDPVMKAN